MSIVQSKAHRSLLELRNNHRFAHCWKIIRKDGVRIHLTDHDAPITFKATGDSLEVTYDPVGGFNPTAHQRKAQLNVNNSEFSGALNTSVITDTDLRAERYRLASITQYRVDWRFPFIGAQFVTYSFFIGETKFTSEIWECEVTGIVRFLEAVVGDTYTRDCRYDLGDRNVTNPHFGCLFDLNIELNLEVAVDANATVHDSFVCTNANIAPLARQQTDNWYDDGGILWLTGLNKGIESEVRIYTYDDVAGSKSTITLHKATPFDIQATDKFDIYPGCKKTLSVCITKFDNIINFGGFPYIPGEDHIRKVAGS